MTRRNEFLPGDFVPPSPPPELRRRTLAAARLAMEQAEQSDLWTRIWRSRTAHLAWAASVAALLFGHIVIGVGAASGPAETLRPVMAAAATRDELAEVIDVERVTVELPGWEIRVSWDRIEPEPPTAEENDS